MVLAKKKAWFTDSLRPQLYGVSYARNATKAKVTTLPLTGDWVQAPGVNNANGIALSPDKRSLLVVQSNTGYLFRVDPKTGVARRVDLGATLLTNGDGLLVRGRTLYAVQNQLNQIAVVHLNKRGTPGPTGRHLDQSRPAEGGHVRRTDDGGLLQGQPLSAQRPVRRRVADHRGVLDHPHPPVAEWGRGVRTPRPSMRQNSRV